MLPLRRYEQISTENNTTCILAISLQWGHFDLKLQVEGVISDQPSFFWENSAKWSLLRYKNLEYLSSVLSQCMRLTDGRTDRQTPFSSIVRAGTPCSTGQSDSWLDCVYLLLRNKSLKLVIGRLLATVAGSIINVASGIYRFSLTDRLTAQSKRLHRAPTSTAGLSLTTSRPHAVSVYKASNIHCKGVSNWERLRRRHRHCFARGSLSSPSSLQILTCHNPSSTVCGLAALTKDHTCRRVSVRPRTWMNEWITSLLVSYNIT